MTDDVTTGSPETQPDAPASTGSPNESDGEPSRRRVRTRATQEREDATTGPGGRSRTRRRVRSTGAATGGAHAGASASAGVRAEEGDRADAADQAGSDDDPTPAQQMTAQAEAEVDVEPGAQQPDAEHSDAEHSDAGAGADVAAVDDGGGGDDEERDGRQRPVAAGGGTSRSARRRRSRRRRQRRQAGTAAARTQDPSTAAEPADVETVDGSDAQEAQAAQDDATTTVPSDATPTQTRSGRGRGRRSPRGASATRRGGRRSVAGVSEETRRAITEGPPRRMLVTQRAERTEIAVLEDRDLVEHYVTRADEESYVGNVYLGRVQNVLPGMEAAFVDIGKGRNGVLYAGEVDVDPEDLDGDVPRIEQTLKPGQTVLVQVTKDPMGTKGARLTQHLSFAGRYCVLAPGDGMLGISRKLPDEERDRLRKILKAIRPDGYGLIVRTAAEGASADQLEADVARVTRIWEGVQQRIASAKALDPVYEEPSLVIRVIRDVYGPEYTDLVIDSETLAERVRSYLGDVSPEMVDTVRVHTGEDLFTAYEVTTQVRRALERKVWLASGGYLIVEKTEAMWVIDVNTGRFVGKSNLEETVLRNNIEAAEEIARQLRLRDMGGIIVIDFVDMMQPVNRDEVLKRFKRELARDKTKSRVMEISKLGLVQMTRKNVSQGLTETFTSICDCCDGRGAKISDELIPAR